LTTAEKLRSISPAHRVEDFSVPLLFFQGMKDKVVSAGPAIKFVREMKKAGKEIQSHFFRDEGHWFRYRENEIFFWQKVEIFLAKHL